MPGSVLFRTIAQLVVEIAEGVPGEDCGGVSSLFSEGFAGALYRGSSGSVIVAGDEDAFDAWWEHHCWHVSGTERYPDGSRGQKLVDGETIFRPFTDDDLACLRAESNRASADLPETLLWSADLGELTVGSE